MEKYRIKEIMKEQGININRLAELVGVKQNTMSDRLKSENISCTSLEKIADALCVPVWTLFKDAPLPETNQNSASGYVEVKDTIYKITSIEDLKRIVELSEEKMNKNGAC